MGLLDTLKEGLEKLAREAMPIDPVVFDDPIATQTRWSPLVPGGSNFRTHRLVELEPERLAMKKSLAMFLFGSVFLVFGAGAMGGMLVSMIGRGELGSWPFGLFGAAFLAVGLYAVWPTSMVFDGRMRQIELKKELVPFGSVHALQIIKERVSGDKSSYWSYELNLVFRDGERKNIVDHGNLERLRSDAAQLRALIGCKLWDATAVH